ncbi:GTP-binding protein [Pyrenophora tritici-repentis]|uniref:Dynamin protein n=2 Tax=Pyrenophora tritici-repentis TaxID=45151 RepID=A0A2W1EBF2_9PLEO|nr:GTP-binding protein [Pyrenophora tritici-repentis Pt-1C-BFP]KAA8618708.1 GTP-binding protein [Pyrenophora tritici-repentis]EDU48560.1 GTP-binding protein [Pyrenophora tritici-repentis Pt-1C-BFP]KAF7449182.1 GTP-binding protein [Pyrenophora tritici-repentis]KAF7570814.1 GTP-binding protein [Pyrenophora tritici-repentis]KAG9383877.1 GTP-binding protein [Pyrenophora tritici-repentis]
MSDSSDSTSSSSGDSSDYDSSDYDSSDCDGADGIVPMSIDPDAVTTGSLQALQSADERKVMDIVDKLRRTGLSGVVELPQLIVCGDQSSGKSSVLEAITEIPFPRKENLCTRFATEIILRRSTESTSTVTITPDKLRPQSEHVKLKGFTKSITDFSQLPDVIEEATLAMGLGAVGGTNSRAFSRDVLSIEITGPNRPQLTLVDLPGLIHATNKAQTGADKKLILKLVNQYMKNPRTIILAVVSAKNDYANQIILDHCRKIDKQGRRTMGIITKPDFLREGTDNELSWIELAQNKDIYLESGWHMLKNRADCQMDFSFEQRNQDEDLFFSQGRYADLPRECVGISSLRERLSKVLLTHLIKELPSLKAEMVDKLQATVVEIEKLGEKRNTIPEQRMALMRISMKMNDILKSAAKGHYESEFFGPISTDANVDSTENIRRFRAVIQHLNMAFANDMRLRGHKFAIGAGPSDDKKDIEEDAKAAKELAGQKGGDTSSFLPVPKHLTRNEAVGWVKKTLERSRGFELPGTFQPMLISQLFWEQSGPWEQIAYQHIAKVAQACKDFVAAVLGATAPAEFQEPLNNINIDKALSNSLADAKTELNKLLQDKARHPSTYNHYFTTTIQQTRQRKYQSMNKAASTASQGTYINRFSEHVAYVDPGLLVEQMNKALEADMDVFSSQEALDTERAYYKDELKYFVNAVAKAVIERHLVAPLPDIIVSPLAVTKMTDKQIESVAAEPPQVTQQRAHLEWKRAMLEKGMDTFRVATGGLKRKRESV